MAATSAAVGNKYRSYLTEEDLKNTSWRFGPPNYEVVDKFFEEGRTQEWPEGSLEEKVQRLLKTWEMEIVHKANPDEFKTVDAKNFTISVNGRKPLTMEEAGMIGGSYNLFLQTGLPKNYRVYDPAAETKDSSMQIFLGAFPRGFAIEILQVYSGPPLIAYKFRHWAFMEGPFKGHAPTGELVEFFGTCVFEMDDDFKILKAEMFYDPGQLLEGLVKGMKPDEYETGTHSGCPFIPTS